ncbi:helix-turn-helix transcriptional regulator [Streptomyces sp. TRM66268-LWL]|uniref:Helix-turn-helix transcriptional regulator n=1 Tax=Streptomyces polyasparticus TaxID=2767826 RepID=A0ABR7SR05_9ACTN|nr:DUF5937 family protein [Streptomyces polyasparticus]MBC9717936.1 helix-turn-helix transcriptional regulator [Streptomyces polyasparticus]
MSFTLDISALPQDRVHERIAFVPSPLAELSMTLHTLSEPGHHPGMQGWATSVMAGLDQCFAERLCEAEFLWRSTFSDIFMPFSGLADPGALPAGTLAEELDQLDKLEDEQFVDAALEFTCTLAYGKLAAAPLLSDADARRRVLELAATRGTRQVQFTQRLLDDPPAVRAWIRRLLLDCEEEFFGDVWARVHHQLAADARHKSELLRHKGLGTALTSASKALSLTDDERTIEVDKLVFGRTVLPEDGTLRLIPTVMGRPHLLVLHRYGWTPAIHYPVAGETLSSTASVEELTRRMEALSHPVRMRLCRNLARGAYTTSELVDVHGMSAPEISRHLAVLRKAGLITARRRGRYVLHQLDLSKVARLGSDFIEGVLR